MKGKILIFIFLAASLYSSESAGQDNLLYGLTYAGGANKFGTLFSYDLTTGKDSVLLNFNNAGNGAKPYGNVVVNPADGFLYGLTNMGGPHNNGVLFSYDPKTKKDSVRFAFDSANGKGPEYGSPTIYNNILYGMSLYGGKYNYGVLFSYNPITNKDSTYINFDTNGQAYYPAGLALTPYSNGLMYGMTYAGGSINRGTIISFNPLTGVYKVEFNLDTVYGMYPIEGTLVLNPLNKRFYGMTYKGGTKNDGVVFCFNPNTEKDSVLFSFAGANGSQPYGSVMYDSVNSLFYGMTSAGGTKAGGVLFSYNPVTGKDSTIFSFTGPNGAVPVGDVILGLGNMLYGMTLYGGKSNLGVLFKYNPVTGQDSILVNFNGTNGSNPYGSVTLAKAPIILSLSRVSDVKSLIVYPNPFTTSATLLFSAGEEHFIEIYDVEGRKLISLQCSGKQYSLRGNNLAQGVYFIKVFDSGHNLVSVAKIVVQ